MSLLRGLCAGIWGEDDLGQELKESSWWGTIPCCWNCLLEIPGHTKPSPTFLTAFQSILSSCLLSLTPLSSLFAAQAQHELNLPKGFLDKVSQPCRRRAPHIPIPLIFQEKVMESCLNPRPCACIAQAEREDRDSVFLGH